MQFNENELLGTHTSIEKTLFDTVVKSYKKGYYNIQIFLGSSYSPTRRIVSEEDIKKSNDFLKTHPINIFTHLPYVYNLASSVKKNTYVWDKDEEVNEYTEKCLKSIEYELNVISKC